MKSQEAAWVLWFCSVLYLWNLQEADSVSFIQTLLCSAGVIVLARQSRERVKPPQLWLCYAKWVVPHKAIQKKSWVCCDSVVLLSYRVDRKADSVSFIWTLLCSAGVIVLARLSRERVKPPQLWLCYAKWVLLSSQGYTEELSLLWLCGVIILQSWQESRQRLLYPDSVLLSGCYCPH
jgi:hypothetical protein